MAFELSIQHTLHRRPWPNT